MFDAHNHLQDPRFDHCRDTVIAEMQQSGITRCVVNGTHARDWSSVASLANQYPDLIIPSFGLHPWFVSSETDKTDWLTQLTHHLDAFTQAGIGECGLDRSPRYKPNIQHQLKAFTAQLAVAAERNLPLSIHCIQAWGPLLEILESHPLPARGFLLHSYSGSAELIPKLTELGAYFSFSGNLLHDHKEKARRIFQAVPTDRLLAETDAPNMRPPTQAINPTARPLQTPVNHPANLPNIIAEACQYLNTSHLSENFLRLFQATHETKNKSSNQDM